MKKAFTMIELVFTIVIIGILAAVAIPKIAATRDDAKVSTIAQNVAISIQDIAAYVTAKGKTDDISDMSNAAKTMVDKGWATEEANGKVLKVAMDNVSDCLKIVIGQGTNDTNLTVAYGTATGHPLCQSLQKMFDEKEYPIALRGKYVKR